MKLYIKQSVFSLGEHFEVRNEYNELVYTVKGSFFEIPKNFKISDANGTEVATIASQLFRLLSRYTIETRHESVELKRNFTFFSHRFELVNTDWSLQGDFFSHNYQVVNGATPIMSIRKHWFTWGDSYELDVRDDKDALLCLCIVIAVDAQISQDNASN